MKQENLDIKDIELQTIELKFTVGDVNKLLEVLSGLPFGVVLPFIQNIQNQALPQVKLFQQATMAGEVKEEVKPE